IEPTAAPSAISGPLPPLEHQITLTEAGSVVVRKGSREVAAWRFAVEPDNPPAIAFLEPVKTTLSGALDISYSLEDDYGVVAALAEIAPVDSGGSGAATPPARPLYQAPPLPLSLPQLRTRQGSGQTTRDLTAHPWAGATVRITLLARDEAGQEGRSAPIEMELPARSFVDPLARAVVEQRASLALDANAAPLVAEGLDALTLAPEKSFDDSGTYLALRSAYHRLVNARDDDGLRDVVDYLWAIALGIEDGEMSLAAEELRAAEEALRQALERNAPDEEIQRLTQQLREAMQRFLEALLEQARRNPQIANLPPNADLQTLRPEDLQRMIDRIEDLARTGARDAARQLLSELQNMLENLQSGMPQMGDMQNGGEMMESLNQLGEMIRRQEELMNRTFRAQRGLNPDGQGNQPMTKEELEEALRQLEQGQQGLQQSLQELMQKLQEMGIGPNGKLGQAGEAMGDAAGNLGAGRPGEAVGDQGTALDALRQGAQGLAQQLANGGRRGGGLRGGDQFPSQDPLGRPNRTMGPDLGTTVKVPDEIDTQRAREILDAIRRRLGEFDRPVIEREYLERLLDRF
ncbi:MAG: TIGR02302 family protein, partial [Bauldia sp.]